MTKDNRYLGLAVMVIFILGVIGYLVVPKNINLEMSGNLREVKDGSIVATAIYSGDKIQQAQNYEIKITPETRITRVTFEFPQTSDAVDMSALPKMESQADIMTMKSDFEKGITVGLERIKLKKGLFGPKLVAEEIRYILPEF
jgi:hypothetical protein